MNERINGYGDNYATRYDLPPLAERRNEQALSLDFWVLHLPGHSPSWSNYQISGCGLADIPGVKPAKRHFPEATHEILMGAINPECSAETIAAGNHTVLRPLNYVLQITTTDAQANAVLRHLAIIFIRGGMPAEPQGITGARELFGGTVAAFLNQSNPDAR